MKKRHEDETTILSMTLRNMMSLAMSLLFQFQKRQSYSKNYVGKVPRVNNVCFCFAFPFFPFPVAVVVVSPSVAGVSPLGVSCPAGCAAAAPAHALTAGVAELPKMFLSDTFPLICGFCLEFVAVGSSGNSAFESLGGAWRGPPCAAAFAEADEEKEEAGRDSDANGKNEDDPGRAVGALNPVAELVDHGVFLWLWRKAGVGVDPGVDPPVRAGNFPGNRCCAGTWFNDGAAAEEEPAA